jgi:hypothetical protein
LHNKLLHIDGLHRQWEDGVPSVWANEYDNEDGDDDIEVDEDVDDLLDAIVRLRNPVSERNYGIDEPHRPPARRSRADSSTGYNPNITTSLQ